MKRGLGLLMVLAVLALLLAPVHAGRDAFLFMRALDGLHFPAGFILAGGLALCVDRARLMPAVILVVLVLLGLAEGVQNTLGRSASWADWYFGAAGAFAAWTLRVPGLSSKIRYAVFTLFLALWFISLMPLANAIRAVHWRASHRPVLAEFQAPYELWLWNDGGLNRDVSLQPSHASGGSLRISNTGATEYFGAAYEAGDADFSAFTVLQFHVTNPSDQPLLLGIRIRDAGWKPGGAGQRNSGAQIPPGTSTQQVVLSQAQDSLDWKHVREIKFFAESNSGIDWFALGRVELR